MQIEKGKLARQLQAAAERRRRERREQLAEKAIAMQMVRAEHKKLGRPSRSDVERAIGYAVCTILQARAEDDPLRCVLEVKISELLVKAGFDRSQTGDVLLRMIETAPAGQERWLCRRESDRAFAEALAE